MGEICKDNQRFPVSKTISIDYSALTLIDNHLQASVQILSMFDIHAWLFIAASIIFNYSPPVGYI